MVHFQQFSSFYYLNVLKIHISSQAEYANMGGLRPLFAQFSISIQLSILHIQETKAYWLKSVSDIKIHTFLSGN